MTKQSTETKTGCVATTTPELTPYPSVAAEIDDFEPEQHFLLHDDGVMRTRTVRVTPAVASAWLDRNAVNRRPSLAHVGRLALDMSAGHWTLTHQGIAFNREGHLIDGQHRLLAVLAAGRPVLMRVTFNVDGTFGDPMDVGKARSAAEVLQVSVREAAVANALVLLETGRTRATCAMTRHTLDHHHHSIDWALKALPMQRNTTANVVAGFAYAWPVARPEVEAFAASFVAGTGASATDPVVVLRRYLARVHPTGAARLAISLATLRCLQAHYEQQEITRLNVNEHGLDFFAALYGVRQ